VLPDRSQLSIPFSAGITQITSADTAENIFSRADEALYKAKNSNDNTQRIVCI